VRAELESTVGIARDQHQDRKGGNKDKTSHLIEHGDHIALISSPDESFF
jgi:hypothetical protein